MLRNGPKVPSGRPAALKWISPIEDYGGPIAGTGGMAYQCKPGTVLLLVQRMRQQGWKLSEALVELTKSQNVGGTWLRRQEEPEVSLAAMWHRVNPNLKPYLPMRERDRRIIELVGSDACSQKAILSGVGHANDGDVRRDLRRLASAGALTVEATLHGTQTWYRWALAVVKTSAWERALEARKSLARNLARAAWLRRLSRSQGCRRLPAREAHGVLLTTDEDEEIRAEQGRHELHRLMTDLMGSWWTVDAPPRNAWAARRTIREHEHRAAVAELAQFLNGQLTAGA